MAAALQMSWQQSLVHQKRKNGVIPPLGLRNVGNSCYLNSVLQCLTYTPPLANFCLNKNHSSSCDFAAELKRDCPFCILEKRIARSLGTELTLDTPARMNNCLRLFADNFRIGRQEDAHEFLRYVIDACHSTCLRLKKLQQLQQRHNGCGGNEGFGGDGNEGFGGDGTVVKEIFGGTLQSQVKCLSCGVESNKVDEIMDMSLDVLNSSSLKESLQKFFQAETLDGNNKYKCENCEKLVAARKQMSLLQAPNILVIQLKRFEGILGGKIDKTISFEEVLVLSSYMCKASKEKHAEYSLFGTIVHSGFSPDSGHYYAYVKDAMDHWYCCNDTYVKLSNLQEVLSEKVYILFFSRTKQRPGPAKAALASNGVKSEDCNGSKISRSQNGVYSAKPVCTKPSVDRSVEKENLINGVKFEDCNGSKIFRSQNGVYSAKPVYTKPSVGHSVEKENLSKSQDNKVPYSAEDNLSSLGNSSSKKFPPTVDVKVVQKIQSNGRNGHEKTSISMENGEPNMLSSNRNGSTKSKTVDAIGNGNIKAYPLANGNGKIKSTPANSVEAGKPEDNNGRKAMTAEVVANKHELKNGGINSPSNISGSKRKLQDEDSCILFAKDGENQAELEDFKKVLQKEASSFLRSCGWTEEVHCLMCSKKKACLQEAGNMASNSSGLKKLLIVEAKRKFLSQIPESLKGNLIKQFRTVSQEK